MMYARGPKVANEFDPDTVAHCARVGNELGADVVKVPYTGDPDSFAKVVEGCCVPVVIAGGPDRFPARLSDHDRRLGGGRRRRLVRRA